MNKNFSFRNKNLIKNGILCSLFIFVCTLLFQNIRIFITSISIIEIKMENVFPPVIGLYFGGIGAAACSIGNFFADLLGGQRNIYILAIKLFFNFLYAYIPYKLWYTFNIKDKCEIPNLNDIKGILN